ncbi:hypothetical protein BDP27DRAFT_1361885 [Rhodocollybia butyracea]|uniref:Uncharacterized protein n=1 Tax=Rhodocollybia butyracea TaxID=206335 RepID=A0A9P5PZW2_9AGAR|nr:hypothetical protein BDP27DRAFT_1361885 [Rhodocollybia butyracea]
MPELRTGRHYSEALISEHYPHLFGVPFQNLNQRREALDWSLESFVRMVMSLLFSEALKMYLIVLKMLYLSIILGYIAGKVTNTLGRLIALYKPDSAVVGTHRQRAWQVRIGKGTTGSISWSPVPIIVVRPVKKAVEKRRADPKRYVAVQECSRLDVA